jgi:hypothetical protein
MAIASSVSEIPVGRLRQDFAQREDLFARQPQVVQTYLGQQGRQIAEALLERRPRIRFALPDRVVNPQDGQTLFVPEGRRQQAVGSRFGGPGAADAREAFLRVLMQLEHEADLALALATASLRHAIARTMIYEMLPDGRPVFYAAADGDAIPSIPVDTSLVATAALMAATDAMVQEEAGSNGRVQVPFAPAARRFFLPQWVAFDEKDRLLINKAAEAEGYLASMQNYVGILHLALTLAPYMVADQTYQRKRGGMLGQLVNQGRALARFYTRDISEKIQHRARESRLNRGLSLTMPFFDDQQLKMRQYDVTIIPAGRIEFVPAFVVRAVRLEAAKVAQDTRINSSTRKHLLAQFAMLEDAFLNFSLR